MAPRWLRLFQIRVDKKQPCRTEWTYLALDTMTNPQWSSLLHSRTESGGNDGWDTEDRKHLKLKMTWRYKPNG